MLLNTPTLLALGVPCKRPVVVLNVAQDGAFEIENVNASPSGSEAVGWNEYSVPCITDAAGVPEIVGARFVTTLATAIENAGKLADALPSLTLIWTLE
jgi:hypothetical protein